MKMLGGPTRWRPLITLVTGQRYISSRAMRNEPLAASRPPPWPYQEKGYSNLHWYIDMHTQDRFDENSKVVVIEGMPGIGKSDVAAKIAEELEMKYFPMVTTDSLYINCYGWDMRSIDHELPPRVRAWDEARFLKEPNHADSFIFRMNKLFLKVSQYFDALAHVLNTGEGVVLDRSIYSDVVFAEAMLKAGYINKTEMKYYKKVLKNCLADILKPHLVIYLDCPIPVIQAKLAAPQRVAKYGPHEKTTLNTKFLEAMEENYKTSFLRDISEHAELLVYDWTEPGDSEVIVEDIERIDFESHDLDIHNPKMMDWRFRQESDANEKRWDFTQRKGNILNYAFLVNHFDVPSLMCDSDDSGEKERILEEHPESGTQYAPGYNASKGETGILWKTKHPSPWQGLGTQTRFI